jgi:hypothetical protein
MTPQEYEQTVLQQAAQQEPPQVVDEETPKIRAEYEAWAKQYGKELSEQRFAIFQNNFFENKQYYEQTGNYYVLNEYADLTPEEYQYLQQVSGADEPQVRTVGWNNGTTFCCIILMYC